MVEDAPVAHASSSTVPTSNFVLQSTSEFTVTVAPYNPHIVYVTPVIIQQTADVSHPSISSSPIPSCSSTIATLSDNDKVNSPSSPCGMCGQECDDEDDDGNISHPSINCVSRLCWFQLHCGGLKADEPCGMNLSVRWRCSPCRKYLKQKELIDWVEFTIPHAH